MVAIYGYRSQVKVSKILKKKKKTQQNSYTLQKVVLWKRGKMQSFIMCICRAISM